MLQSHVVEVNGTFVGAAITIPAGFRFRAIHIKVDELDESTWLSMDELDRAVRHLFITGQLSPNRHPVGVDSLQSAASALLPASATGTPSWMA